MCRGSIVTEVYFVTTLFNYWTVQLHKVIYTNTFTFNTCTCILNNLAYSFFFCVCISGFLTPYFEWLEFCLVYHIVCTLYNVFNTQWSHTLMSDGESYSVKCILCNINHFMATIYRIKMCLLWNSFSLKILLCIHLAFFQFFFNLSHSLLLFF